MSTTDEFENVYPDEGSTSINDPQGNVIIHNDPTASNPFGGAIADFILFGITNGAFQYGPSQGVNTSIGSNNPMPYWTGPWVVSGNSIDVQWVSDSASPSGYNLRFTMNVGAAGDAAYMEQIVPIGGSRWQWTGDYLRTAVKGVSGSFSGVGHLTLSLQYLDATLAPTGSVYSSNTNTLGSNLVNPVLLTSTTTPPANAHYAQIRIGVNRNSLATTNVLVMDFTDVRLDRAVAAVLLGDIGVQHKAPAAIQWDTTHLTFSDDTGSVMFDITKTLGINAYQTLNALAGLSLGGALISNVINPTVSGSQNDWSPTGLSTCSGVVMSLSGAYTITGFDATGFVDGQTFFLQVYGTSDLTLSHNSSSSSSGNRFTLPGGASYTVSNRGGVWILYYSAVNAVAPWHILDN